MFITRKNYTLKLAETAAEIQAAQRLRYRVFVEEMGANCDPKDAALGLERDAFDAHVDHLILLDQRASAGEEVVAAYRLLQSDVAAKVGYYGASEFDLSKLISSGRKLVEMGRSCVAKQHRGGVAMHMLWTGVAQYVLARDIEIMFGTASFSGTDYTTYSQGLSYLHHTHLAPPDIRVNAIGDHAGPTDLLPKEAIDPKTATAQIPPLIQAYTRLGGFIGQGVYVDHDFNTTDVCVLLDTARMSEKHRQYYTKKGR